MKVESAAYRMTTLGERSPPIDTATNGAAVTPLSDFFVRGVIQAAWKSIPMSETGQRSHWSSGPDRMEN
jgi:hypothetical protein